MATSPRKRRSPPAPGQSAVATALREELEAQERAMSPRQREQVQALAEELSRDLYCQVNHCTPAEADAALQRTRERREALARLLAEP